MPKTQLHGLEAYRDVYFKMGTPEVLARFGATNIRDLFNGVYTKIIDKGGEVFLSSKEMKEQGYFYIPTKLIKGEIVVRRDFNLVDQFEITLIANFLQTSSLKIKEMSTGNEKYNQAFTGSNVRPEKSFGEETIPYYPMMDTILLNNLYVKARLGYIKKPEHNIAIEGVCVGITPNFRSDGYPIVTLTFRDIGWALGKHVLSTTYPVLNKDRKLEGKTTLGDTRNDG